MSFRKNELDKSLYKDIYDNLKILLNNPKSYQSFFQDLIVTRLHKYKDNTRCSLWDFWGINQDISRKRRANSRNDNASKTR